MLRELNTNEMDMVSGGMFNVASAAGSAPDPDGVETANVGSSEIDSDITPNPLIGSVGCASRLHVVCNPQC